MLAYLRGLPAPKVLLWCYFIWYALVVARYFEPKAALWGTSLGLSAIIGTGLYISTAYAGAVRRPLGFWPVFRFYLDLTQTLVHLKAGGNSAQILPGGPQVAPATGDSLPGLP